MISMDCIPFTYFLQAKIGKSKRKTAPNRSLFIFSFLLVRCRFSNHTTLALDCAFFHTLQPFAHKLQHTRPPRLLQLADKFGINGKLFPSYCTLKSSIGAAAVFCRIGNAKLLQEENFCSQKKNTIAELSPLLTVVLDGLCFRNSLYFTLLAYIYANIK